MFKNILNLFKNVFIYIFALILSIVSIIPIMSLICNEHIFDTAIYNWLLAMLGSIFPLFLCYKLKQSCDSLVEDLALRHAGVFNDEVGKVLNNCLELIKLIAEKQITAEEAKDTLEMVVNDHKIKTSLKKRPRKP